MLTANLTMLGLIVGFTFSMAVNRYDQRKLYEEQEANAIATEYLRSMLLPEPDGEKVRQLLRQYLDHRIMIYENPSKAFVDRVDPVTAQLQTQMSSIVRSSALPQPTPLMSLALAGMDDVLSSQSLAQAAWRNRIPVMAWALMGLIAISSQVMLGLYLRSARSTGILLIILPAILSVSFFLIADLDSQSGGVIRISPLNLIGTAESLKH